MITFFSKYVGAVHNIRTDVYLKNQQNTNQLAVYVTKIEKRTQQSWPGLNKMNLKFSIFLKI